MRADTLKDLGIVSTKLKEYEEARNYYQQSLTLFEQLGIVRERASALQDLGNLADLQGMYKEARNFYQQSLEIRERLVLLC